MFKRLGDEKYYRQFYFQDSFYAQCMDVDPLTMEQFDRAAAQVRALVKCPEVRRAKRVLATGCGDSNLVAFAVKEAFAHYLPDVEYEAVEAIELSRHYPFQGDGSDTIAVFISVSGGIFRTIEALKQCRRHGVTTIAMTGRTESPTAKEADLLYYLNCPPGDNNAGLRTYYMNVMSLTILAAAMAEELDGQPRLPALREQVQSYHDRFFGKIEEIEKACFEAAIHWMDKKYIEILGDGPMFWAGKFIQAKIVELSGDPCTVIDSENYMHVNSLMGPGSDIASLVLMDSRSPSADNLAAAVNAMVERTGREVLVFSDVEPEKLGIQVPVRYCPLPQPDRGWEFLSQIYAYLPGAIFGGFRHTTIGEPMFRGGMDPTIFIPTYFSPIEVVER